MKAGFGHMIPSMAVKHCIEELYPGEYDVEVLDFIAKVGAKQFDAAHKNVWNFLTAFPPGAF